MPTTRDRIVQCAAEAFAAEGFRMATIRDIAVAAAINEITVYRYFPRKQMLYWEAIEWKLLNSGLVDSLANGLRASEDLSTLIRRLSATVFEVNEQDGTLARLLYFAALELKTEKQRLIDQHIIPFLNLLTDRISDWVSAGTIRSLNPRSTALMIAGMLLSQLNAYEFVGPESRHGQSWRLITDELVDVLSRSIQ